MNTLENITLPERGVKERPGIPTMRAAEILSLTEQIGIKVLPPPEMNEFIRNNACTNVQQWSDYYFDYAHVSMNETRYLVLSNSARSSNDLIVRPTVINQRKELCKYFLNLGEENEWVSDFRSDTVFRDKLLIEIVTIANMQKLCTNNKEDVIREYFINSQNAYQEVAGNALHHGFQPDVYWVTDNNYNQTEHFGWIYGNEVGFLKKLISQGKQGRLKVLDDATGFGHFIFTAANLLSEEELAQVDFTGADYKMKDMSIAIGHAASVKGLHATWLLEDIDKKDHFQKLLRYNHEKLYDLIVVNHTIEHLNEKPLVYYLTGWLSISNCLIISVPFEDSLENSVSSHHHLFNEEILTQLGNKVINHHHLSIGMDTSFIRGGMLILYRTHERKNG